VIDLSSSTVPSIIVPSKPTFPISTFPTPPSTPSISVDPLNSLLSGDDFLASDQMNLFPEVIISPPPFSSSFLRSSTHFPSTPGPSYTSFPSISWSSPFSPPGITSDGDIYL